MLKALLCDDNEIVLEGLQKQMDWKGLGIELIGVSSDGEEAMQKLSSCIPDILITDIMMPYYDGLQLAEKARTLNNDISIIIISGYDDFEYARKAVRLSVVDYILKPVNPDDLTNALKKAAAYCIQTRKSQRSQTLEILRKILQKNIGSEEIQKQCAAVQLDRNQYCCVLTIQIGIRELGLMADDIQYAADLRFLQFLEYVQTKNIYTVERAGSSCQLLLLGDEKSDVINLRERIITSTRDFFAGYYCNDIVIAAGDVHQGLEKIRESQNECIQALRLHFVKGANATIYYHEIPHYKKTGVSGNDSIGFLDIDFIEPLLETNKQLLNERLDLLYEHLKEKGGESFVYMTFTVGNFYTHVMKELNEAGYNIGEVFDDPMEEFIKVISSNTLDIAIINLKRNLTEICDYISTHSSHHSRTINTALRYIQNNYSRSNLSIEDVAAIVFLSTSHFSTIFKNETGQTFTDYLICIRMTKAKELLTNSNDKVYEISSRIGYENAAYFSAAFKRYTGFSPSEYKLYIDSQK